MCIRDRSTLLNALMDKPQLTSSRYPGTTLDFNPLDIHGVTVYDTPGLTPRNSMLLHLEEEDLKTVLPAKDVYKRQVLSHGFVMDGKGVKMSKSQWNAVAPGEITKKYGADILRLWAASVDYQADCSMSEEILKQISENYRKVRNTFRFLLANINNEDDFTKADLVDVSELPKLDQYMLALLDEANAKCQLAYQEYRFSDVTTMLTNLMTNEFSAYYLDFTKDILYIEKKDSPRRRQVQTVLYHAVNVLVRLWAPILVHTAEEVNDFFKGEEESIHLGRFAEPFNIADAEALKAKVGRLMQIRSDIFKALEEARAEKVIGKSLEAVSYTHLTATSMSTAA